MVSFYDDRIAFVHIPKNGGTSVSDAFGRRDYVHWSANHACEPAKYYRERLEGWDERFSFAIVRNPWDRLTSQYRFSVHHRPDKINRLAFWLPREKRQRELEKCQADFKYWLLEFCEKFGYWPRGLDRQDIPFTRMPQSYWTHDGGRQVVSRIYRFESLREFWQEMQRFGIEERCANATWRDDYRRYYDHESREYVERHFASDIRHFGYDY